MPYLQSPLDGFLILWDILGYVAPCDAYTRTNLRLSGSKVGDVIPLPLICPTWRVPDLHA